MDSQGHREISLVVKAMACDSAGRVEHIGSGDEVQLLPRFPEVKLA